MLEDPQEHDAFVSDDSTSCLIPLGVVRHSESVETEGGGEYQPSGGGFLVRAPRPGTWSLRVSLPDTSKRTAHVTVYVHLVGDGLDPSQPWNDVRHIATAEVRLKPGQSSRWLLRIPPASADTGQVRLVPAGAHARSGH